jgi:uncharacterized membrane protein YdjX (TVP38/TMEM64 family)
MRGQTIFWAIVLVIGAVIAIIAWFGGINLETLREQRPWLIELIESNGPLAASVFIIAATLALLTPFPLGSVITASAGFLFGPYLGTVLMVATTLLSGTMLYLASKSTFGHSLQLRAGKWFPRLKQESQQSPFVYVLALRLMPALPFFVVSILPALVGIGIRPYLAASLIGSVPGLFSVAVVGSSLGAVFEAGGDLSQFELMSEQTFLFLTALSILALVPAVQHRLFRGNAMRR